MKKASHAGRKNRSATNPVTRAAAAIQRKSQHPLRLGIILGSGVNGVLKHIRAGARIPFGEIPGFPESTVPGHDGKVVLGKLGGVEVVALAGRAHYYEGHSMETVTFSVRVLAKLGVQSVLITNAAGGLNPRFHAGDFMMLTDHINFMGANPLRSEATSGGSGFVDLTQAYDQKMQALLRRAARQIKVPLRQGVYLAVSGPSYETPAEIRAFRRLGADAVGMSTVPEVIVARQEGLRVAGLSCITNPGASMGGTPLDHSEVLKAGERAARQMARLLEQFARFYGEHG